MTGEFDQDYYQGVGVERQLAQYAFVREERDREVRLLFRDVAASEIARAFRAAGASLITLSGERTGAVPAVEREAQPGEAEEGMSPRGSGRRHKGKTERAPPRGEPILRYFYALGELVYTVSIISPSGVVASVAGIYPSAALSERELQDRISLVFVRPEA